MNEGLFETSHGAPLEERRVRYKLGQGASQVIGEALVLRTTDFSAPTLRSVGAGAAQADVTDLVIQVPIAAGRGGQAVAAAGGLSLQVPDGGIAGGNRRGNGAVDLQTTRSAATNVASGANAFLVGQQSTASGAASIALGFNLSSTGTRSLAAGDSCSSTATASMALGQNCVADGAGAVSLGVQANARGIIGTLNFAGSQRAAGGDRNLRRFPQAAVTTNATATTLTTNGAAEATTNTWVLPNNSTGVFTGYVVARNTTGNDSIAWRIEGMVSRDATAATVALIGTPTVTQIASDASMSTCVLAVNVNTTNGSLRLQFTGLAAATIAVNGWMDGSENA